MSTQISAAAQPPLTTTDEQRRGLLTAAAITAAAASAANLAIWALADALVDVPVRFTPLQPGSVVFMTVVGVILAAGFLALLAKRSNDPTATFRRIVPIALVVSLVPDVLIWSSGAYAGAAEAQTVLPLMGMHVVTAAIAWVLLPSALARSARPGLAG
jgi:hypothetical protein